MLDRAKLDQMEDGGAAAAMKYRDELGAGFQAAVNDTVKALNAYFDDVKGKRRAISERVDALQEELSNLETSISDYGPALAQATISGDGAALESIQREIADLEANKAAVSAQIDLLSKVQITGDADLYSEANELADKLETVNRETLADLAALGSFAEKQAALWHKVANFSEISGNMVPVRSVLARVKDMRKDFSAED